MILKIKNKKVEFFNSFSLNLRYDSVASAFAFNVYFDPENEQHKDLMHLGHYHTITVEHNDELLVTGFMISETFNDSSVKELASIGGYSLPGVLEDCEIPTSLYPLQSDKLTLKEIAQKLLKPFKIKMVVDPAVASKLNVTYDISTASESQSVKSYLCELASQKNVIISHTEKGELLFTEAKTNKAPILHFERGIPNTKFSLAFNGQAMHSQITVQKQASVDGGNAGESTVTNPFVPFVFRPKVISQSSGDDNDTLQAAKNALAAELKNIKLTIVTDRWEIDGKILKPNNIISVLNPEVYIFKKTNFFIENISFVGNHESTTATLTCVLPEVYNGKDPKNVFEH